MLAMYSAADALYRIISFMCFPRWQSARYPRHTDYFAQCHFLFDVSYVFGTVQGLHNAGLNCTLPSINWFGTVQIEVAECKLAHCGNIAY